VRWPPRRHASGLALPSNDFWLFDDSSVVFRHFAGNGELAPDDKEFTNGPVVVKLCADAFEVRLATRHPAREVHSLIGDAPKSRLMSAYE
jgi:hypothetical protein